jgi:hypothetical protein
MVIGPGRVNLSWRRVWARAIAASKPRTLCLRRSGSGDGRHFRVVTIVADAHRDPSGKIDTLDVFEKAVHEVLARLLAVGDDIDPGVFLLLQHQPRRVPLRLDERLTLQLPGRPQHPGFGQPSWLWQAAGDRGFEHVTSPFRLPSPLAGHGDRPHIPNPADLDALSATRRPSHAPSGWNRLLPPLRVY